MDQRDIYARQVKRLMTALPYVAKEPCFALKGGTAGNLTGIAVIRSDSTAAGVEISFYRSGPAILTQL